MRLLFIRAKGNFNLLVQIIINVNVAARLTEKADKKPTLKSIHFINKGIRSTTKCETATVYFEKQQLRGVWKPVPLTSNFNCKNYHNHTFLQLHSSNLTTGHSLHYYCKLMAGTCYYQLSQMQSSKTEFIYSMII